MLFMGSIQSLLAARSRDTIEDIIMVATDTFANQLPHVVTPESLGCTTTTIPELAAWASSHRDDLTHRLTEQGAILFRGFDFANYEMFQDFVGSITSEVLSYARGATPRRKISGRIYTSTEANARIPIPLHCEMSSYGSSVPSKIFFYCDTPPRRQGQTPIADMHAMYNNMDPDVRDRFESRGLRMIQNVPERLSRRTLGATKTWSDMFETEDRSEVEAYCQRQGIDYKWKTDGTIQLINYIDAAITHPVSGLKVWFNSAHNYFPTWSWEMDRLGLKVPKALFRFVEWRQKRLFPNPENLPNYVTYADGGKISPADIVKVRQAYWDNAVFFDWQRSDVLLLDNLRVAHGRMPFRGERKILVALAESWTKDVPLCLRSDPDQTAAAV